MNFFPHNAVKGAFPFTNATAHIWQWDFKKSRTQMCEVHFLFTALKSICYTKRAYDQVELCKESYVITHHLLNIWAWHWRYVSLLQSFHGLPYGTVSIS
jgi:hypothetical protein